MFWCVELPCTFTQFYEFVQYCNSTHQLDLLIRNLLSNSTTYAKEQNKRKTKTKTWEKRKKGENASLANQVFFLIARHSHCLSEVRHFIKRFKTYFFKSLIPCQIRAPVWGIVVGEGRVFIIMDYIYEEAPPERRIFFRLEVYKRVRFSWAAVEMDSENCHLGIKDGAY